MSESTILALPSGVNDPEALIDGEVNGQPAILSTRIADHFNKNHKHILRDIDALRSILPTSFTFSNIEASYYTDPTGRKLRAYLLTRDAFSLLVMGMTGKAAIFWKLRYIEAFNALEKAAADHLAELAAEAAYLAGRQEALSLPVMEAERKAGYLDGLKEGKRLAEKDDRFESLVKIRAYVRKGLSYSEIGKLLGLHRSTIGKRISRAKKLGFWPDTSHNAQGNLFGAA